MTSPAAVEQRPPDPFAVPSGTTLRFALLVSSTSVLVMWAVAARIAALSAGADTQADVADYLTCRERANRAMDSLDGPSVEHCGLDPRVVPPWLALAALLAFWLLVFAVYWFLPAWRIRRRRYLPLADELPDVARELEELRRGVHDEPVTWHVEPLEPRISALAFGRWGRRHIVLSGGLLAVRGARPAAFRAVLLHELAHLRNRDVDISFLTIAVGRVALPVVLLDLPAGIAWPLLWGGGTGAAVSGLATSLQTLCLLLVVPLSRSAVLRSREFYADARAARWSDSPDDLRELFHGPAVRRGLRSLLRVHPPERQRRAMLDDASPLFRSGFWELFAVGCVLGALYSGIDGQTSLYAERWHTALRLVGLTPAVLVAGALTAAVVGLLALRANEGFPPGTRARVLRAPAWGLGCGLALGGGALDATTWYTQVSVGQSGLGLLPWAALLGAAALVSARWMDRTLGLWRQGTPARRSLTRGFGAFAAAVGMLFAGVLGWLMTLPTAEALAAVVVVPGSPEVVAFVVGAVLQVAVSGPLLVCAVGLAALLPVVAQGRATGAYPGALRETRRTVRGGVRCGLWLMASVVALDLTGRTGGFLGLLLVTAAVLVLAVHTGRRPRRHGLAPAHAVAASTLAGAVAFAGSCLFQPLVGLGTGRFVPDVPTAAFHFFVSALPALVVTACVPAVRNGRAPRHAPGVERLAPRQELRPTVAGGIRWGGVLLVALTAWGLTGSTGLAFGFSVVIVALVVLAVRTGRAFPGPGRAFGHAWLAATVACVVTVGGRFLLQSLVHRVSGGDAPHVTTAASDVLFCATPAWLVAACAPAFRGRRASAPDRAAARRTARPALVRGARWGLWLLAPVVVLGLLGPAGLGFGALLVMAALVVLAVRSARAGPGGYRASVRQAWLATTAAGTVVFGGDFLLSLPLAPLAGGVSPDPFAAVADIVFCALPGWLVAACVPAFRRRRRPAPPPVRRHVGPYDPTGPGWGQRCR